MQGIGIYALPEVKEIRYYPHFEPNDNTNVSCPTPLAFNFTSPSGEVTTVRIDISPLDNPEDIERELNVSLANAGIDIAIHVAVEFFGDEGEDVGVRFLFVTLTPFEALIGPPEIIIETDASNISCTNLNSEVDPIHESVLSARAEINTVQNLTFAHSFKIGYENLTVLPGVRFTDDFSYDITTDSLEKAIFNLFGWGCDNQPIGKRYSAYQTYEGITYEDNVDISTSLCGHASLKNPQRLWEVSESNALTIGIRPFFVSEFLLSNHHYITS